MLLVRYLFYNQQMETGSPVSDVGSNILPQSKILTTLAFVHWTKTAFFGGEFIKCNPLLNNARNQMIIANLRSE